MNFRHFVLAEGTLALRTNLPEFKWSYGINAPLADTAAYDACAVRLTVIADDELSEQPLVGELSAGKYHYFSGLHGSDRLHYRRDFLFGRTLRMDVEGLLGSAPTMRVNRAYLRFITHRFMNLHSAGYILTDIASLLLLRRGYSPVHCSGFRSGDATVVILAPPNTGKTLCTMMACMEHGADFIAEDLAITNGADLIAVPWTSTFRYYSNIDDSIGSRTRQALNKRIPVLELVPGAAPKPVTDFITPEKVVQRSRVTHVVLLERGAPGVEAQSADAIVPRALNLNRYEFNYVKAPTLVAYEYFNPAIGVIDGQAAEHRILAGMVTNAAERLVVRTTDPTKYASMILAAVNGRSA